MTLSRRWGNFLAILGALAVGLLAALLPATASQAAVPTRVNVQTLAGEWITPSKVGYCAPRNRKPHCLFAPSVTMVSGCDANGGKVDFTFDNPNTRDVTVDIIVYFNEVEFFGDQRVLPPGTTPLQYFGMPPGTAVQVWVGSLSDGLTFGELFFTSCAA